jgi:hypothetical protein
VCGVSHARGAEGLSHENRSCRGDGKKGGAGASHLIGG